MGLINDVKDTLGMGSSGADGIEEDWVEEIESEVEESDEDMDAQMEEEQEPEVKEWDSAYKFAEEYLEVRGFSSMVDFTNKCMAYKINQSPMYRDKIANGVDTMNRITSMHDQLSSIQGGGGEGKNMSEKAKELKAANEVIDEAQKLSGQEDAMVRDVIGLGEDLVNVMADQGRMMEGGGVNSNVNQRNEEM